MSKFQEIKHKVKIKRQFYTLGFKQEVVEYFKQNGTRKTVEKYQLSITTFKNWIRLDQDNKLEKCKKHVNHVHQKHSLDKRCIFINEIEISCLKSGVMNLSNKEKYRFIKASKYPVAILCKILKVHHVNYLRFLKNYDPYASVYRNGKNRLNDEQLLSKIYSIFNESFKHYGYLRVFQTLKQDYSISKKRVMLMMRKHKITPQKKTPKKSIKQVVSENLIENMVITKPHQVWVSDISYIPTKQGNLYLSMILDLFSRSIISYVIDDNMKTSMVIKSIALGLHKKDSLVYFHTDKGSQYTSYEFRDYLLDNGFLQSMSQSCYHNSNIESFFGRMKTNIIKFDTKKQAKEYLENYFIFYNNKRIHSSLKMTPKQYLEKYDLSAI